MKEYGLFKAIRNSRVQYYIKERTHGKNRISKWKSVKNPYYAGPHYIIDTAQKRLEQLKNENIHFKETVE